MAVGGVVLLLAAAEKVEGSGVEADDVLALPPTPCDRFRFFMEPDDDDDDEARSRFSTQRGQRGILPERMSGKMVSPGTRWPHWMHEAVAREPWRCTSLS